jgi:hypothetical protein
MRLAIALAMVLALLVPALAQKPAPAQKSVPAQKAETPAPGPSDLEKQLLNALAKYEYRAKRDVPAADSIFVENGRLNQSMYKLSLQQGGVLLKSGLATKVSSVKIMEHGIQIFFATDKCALMNVAAETDNLPRMPLQKLVDLSKTAIGALFEITPLKEETPAAGKQDEQKKPD